MFNFSKRKTYYNKIVSNHILLKSLLTIEKKMRDFLREKKLNVFSVENLNQNRVH
jgi:hypothetical protein